MNTPMESPVPQFKERELQILRLIADGLSNQEIADRLFIAPTTVRWYNRQIYAKLDTHSRTLAVARANKFGLLHSQIALEVEAATARLRPETNLPMPTTPLVGRTNEIAKVRQLLASTRLLTLTGSGGIGKTRLALHVAEVVLDYFEDGVFFVSLASISDPAKVAHAIADGLTITENAGVPIEATLINYLRQRQLLLIIDNFEHIISAAPLLSSLLQSARGLKLLVTSRESLHLYGEQEYPVPPLTVPHAEDALTVKNLSSYESVALFIQRAQAVKPDFQLTNENSGVVAALCVRLNGLPLATELAAARIKLLTPQDIVARLEKDLSVLSGGPTDAPARQRTLHATIDWSYNLLDDAEKTLFARVAVFCGGWSLDALEAICSPGLALDVLDALASLVDKSLVLQSTGVYSEPRFSMLETIREYALERLEASEESAEIYARHHDWYLELAEHGDKGLRGPTSTLWFERLREEEANLQQALEWSKAEAGGKESGLRLAGALWTYWHMRGSYTEGRAWLDLLLSQIQSIGSPYMVRALNGAGILAYRQGDYDRVSQLCGDALALCKETEDREGSALALHYLAHVAQDLGDMARAQESLETSLALYREIADEWGIGQTLNCLGDFERYQGGYNRAAELIEESITLQRAINNRRGICAALSNLGFVRLRQGEYARAVACFKESLAIARELHNESFALLLAAGFAGVAASQGHPAEAARVLGAVGALLPVIGYALEPADRADYDVIVAVVREKLDTQTFAAAWASGQKMLLPQALANTDQIIELLGD